MIAFAVLCLVVVANAATIDKCVVGNWREWGQCHSNRQCSRSSRVPFYSYPKPAAVWDEGRVAMKQMMKDKTEQREHDAACRADGTCPEMMSRPTSGSYQCVDGLASDIPCWNVDQLAFLNFVDLGYVTMAPGDVNPRGNDVWGWTDPQNGDEYAIAGLSGGTSFVRITDPENPVPVGFIYTATRAAIWRDIKVIGNYAYIVADVSGHGMQVFDLTHLRGLTSMTYFDPDAWYQGFGNCHNIVSNSDTNFVYGVGATQTGGYPQVCSGGLFAVDVSDPLNPTYAGCFGGDGYVHDAQCVIYHGPDTTYVGREICYCFNEDTFTIVDVDEKSNMFIISKRGYNNAMYTHQGWVTEDHTVALLDDELDEQNQPNQYTKTYVWDIKDMDNPVLMNIFQAAQQSIDHNQYILGDLTYQANYESGMRILHINQETFALQEVGYFDVLPTRTTANFAGTWSVFPYFASGVVPVGSIDFGLFLTKPNIPAIRQELARGEVHAEQTRTRPVLYNVDGAQCPPVTETRTCPAPVC